MCRVLGFALLFSLLINLSGAKTMEKLSLIPAPQEIKMTEGKAKISGSWTIMLKAKTEDDEYAAKQISDEIRRSMGYDIKIMQLILDDDKVKKCIILDEKPEDKNESALFNSQGYLLSVNDKVIRISATTAQGRFYGAQTLRQLIRQAEDNEIQALEIKDYPALEWRGISDDISRGQVSTLEDFRKIIRELAFYKKNMYQPYIEDLYAFESDEKVGRDNGGITPYEMSEMVKEAKKHHMVICPVFEALGHQDRLLNLPDHRKYAELQDPNEAPWSFSPVLPESYDYVTRLIDELAIATPNPFFHIGGDESFDIGKGTSKDKVQELGVGRVHAEYFSKLADHIKTKFKRRTLMYSDMLNAHEEAFDYLSKDAILIDWHYSPADDYPTVAKLKEKGFDVMVSPGIWGWACFYPNYRLGFDNVAKFVKVGKDQKVMGSITSSWGDSGNESIRENNWPAYAFSAACEWQNKNPETDPFLVDFTTMYYGKESRELAETIKILGWMDYLEGNYPWNIFHNPIRVRKANTTRLDQMKKLSDNMEKAEANIKKASGKIKLNKEHLDILMNVVQRYKYMAKKEMTTDLIAKTIIGKKAEDISDHEKAKILAEFDSLRSDLLKIIADYPALWLRTNKYPKLPFNLERLNNQVDGISGIMEMTRNNKLYLPEEPAPVLFWYPEGDPKVQTPEKERYFIRHFVIDEMPISAEIKCWADDKVLVYLNGRQMMTAEYGNLPKINSEAIKQIKKGDNYIAFTANNAYGAGCVVFQMTLVYQDRRVEFIVADDKMKAAVEVEEGWKTTMPISDKWVKALIINKGLVEPWASLEW